MYHMKQQFLEKYYGPNYFCGKFERCVLFLIPVNYNIESGFRTEYRISYKNSINPLPVLTY
jgi:hypothetical protein